MGKSTQEREWKYMRGVQNDLLCELCRRINEKSITILKTPGKSEHKKYLEHYRHVRDSDAIVAECFDDWSRSKLMMKLVALQKHGLLRPGDLERLSQETRETIEGLGQLD